MQPIIVTSDKTSWALRPMLYLADRYWPGMPPTLIGGYTPPPFDLPAHCTFHSIGNFAHYPVERWSNGLIEFLLAVPDEIILFLMDDYWFNTPVNAAQIERLTDYLNTHARIARLDLTADRLGASGWRKIGSLWDSDLILSDPNSLYHFSFQAALWRKSMLLQCLEHGLTPWEAEMNGDHKLRALGYHVVGTTRPPLRYTIAIQKGRLALDGGYQTSAYALPQEDIQHIKRQGWLP